MRLLPAALLGLLACGSEPVPAAGSLDGSVESHFDPPSGRTSSPTSPRSVGGEGECARVLVVFDRSGSMGLEWEGATLSGPRWRLAADAVEAVLGPVAERVEAGALLFPSGPRTDPRACAPVDPLDAQIPWRDGAAFLDAWRATFASASVGGTTPLDAAFARADEALAAGGDTPTLVLVLTDGEPTCAEVPGAASRARDWAAAGVETWVVGLPGARGGLLLEDIAAAGGTSLLLIDTPEALTERLAEIVDETVQGACR